MTFFQALVLGLIQGITEFLPISSSGHLVILPWFFDWKDPGLAYSVFLHLGTVIAVFLYFIKDWFSLVRGGIQSLLERRIGVERERILFWYIVVGTIPAVIAGVALHDYAESEFRSPLVVCVALAVVGFLLYWIDGVFPAIKRIQELTLRHAIWIGVAQAFAIIPGVSRSGATIAMGRLLSFKRDDCAKFSFLLSFPIILGASIFEWKNLSISGLSGISWSVLIAGFLSSFLSGLLTIHFLLLFVRRADFRVFAWYRILLAGFILVKTLFWI